MAKMVLDIYKKGSSGHHGSVKNFINLVELQAASLLVYLPLLKRFCLFK